MNLLTEAEEQVMLKLWKLGSASAKEILEQYHEDPPAYNTVSTIIRILEKKKFIKHRKKGKKYIYYPKVEMLAYRKMLLEKMARDYFDNDFLSFTSEVNSVRPLQSIIQSNS